MAVFTLSREEVETENGERSNSTIGQAKTDIRTQ